MATQKATQFALPHTTTYTLVDSFHTGSLLDGGGTACQNCGKLITNVGVVQDGAGAKFNVGMDCAATLAGLAPFALDQHNARFQQAKTLVAKIRKQQKEFAAALTVTAQYSYDGLRVSVDGMVKGTPNRDGRRFTETYEKELFEKVILPAAQGLVPAATQPVKDWFGTLPSPYQRGQSVAVLVKGERKEAKVLGISANRSYPDSPYSEIVCLNGVTGWLDPAELQPA